MSVQRGFALIAILSLAALMSAFLIASAINLTSAGVSNEREQRSMNALRKAKAALIAYAASEQWQIYKGQPSDQPGGLPCPDGNDDGSSEGICPNALSRIGRLPWATIGSEDLRDASGERLWYAVSSNFRRLSGTTVINSDTPGLLAVTGKAPASNVVAVVIAPGEAISGQDRLAQHNNPAAYLEGVTVGSPLPPDSTFDTIALPSGTANDRLIVITQSELMAAVEPVVAARIERDIKPYITQNYLSANGWSGGYPFAVSWGGGPGQPQDNYKGDATTPTYSGLMPITREANWVAWQTSSINVSNIPGAGTGDPSFSSDCSASTSSEISCQIDYNTGGSDRPAIQLQATVLNAGKSFVKAVDQGDKIMTDNDGTLIDWSNSSPTFTPTLTNSLQASGNGTVVFRGRLRNGNSTEGRVTIRVPVSYHPISNSADTTSGWFIANQWYRQTYYAVAQGYVPGGIGSCTAGGTCLTVNNLPAPFNNKRLILVFAGRALNGSTRPSGTLTDYFELQNSTPADLIFQHHPWGLPTTINDRVVVVAP